MRLGCVLLSGHFRSRAFFILLGRCGTLGLGVGAADAASFGLDIELLQLGLLRRRWGREVTRVKALGPTRPARARARPSPARQARPGPAWPGAFATLGLAGLGPARPGSARSSGPARLLNIEAKGQRPET